MKSTEEHTRNNIGLAKQRGEKGAAIAKWHNVSLSTVDKIWSRYKKTGSYMAIPYTGRKSTITEEQDREIIDTLERLPDITLEDMLEATSLSLSVSGLSRKLKRMGLHIKKNTLPQRTKPPRCAKKTHRLGRNDADFRY